MPSLCETYHPKSWSEIVGQKTVVRRLDLIRQRRGTLAGGNFWISGLSGTGKSTAADLIAAEIAHPACVHEFCGRNLGVDDVAAMRREMSTMGFAPGGRVVCINEAHSMRKGTIEALLDAMDQRTLPGHAAWILTTTLRGQATLFEDYDDAHPLLSRCTKLELTTDGLAYAFAKRAQEIATIEGLDYGASIERYHALVVECELNFRDVLNQLESGVLADFGIESEEPDFALSAAPARRSLLVGRR